MTDTTYFDKIQEAFSKLVQFKLQGRPAMRLPDGYTDCISFKREKGAIIITLDTSKLSTGMVNYGKELIDYLVPFLSKNDLDKIKITDQYRRIGSSSPKVYRTPPDGIPERGDNNPKLALTVPDSLESVEGLQFARRDIVSEWAEIYVKHGMENAIILLQDELGESGLGGLMVASTFEKILGNLGLALKPQGRSSGK